MERAAENAGLPARAFSDDALASLRAYEWPGNVRQLRNVIEWVPIMAPGRPPDPVRLDMLPPDSGSSAPASTPRENRHYILFLPLLAAPEECSVKSHTPPVLLLRRYYPTSPSSPLY